MKALKHLKRVCILLTAIVCAGLPSSVFSQADMPGFSIRIYKTLDGLRLTCEEGCAWTELNWTSRGSSAKTVNQNGMVGRKKKAAQGTGSDAFRFRIKKTRTGISLTGEQGTAWTELNFTCPEKTCDQQIDQNGMVAKE